MLGRAPSTASREVRRNGGHRRYCAARADAQAWARARRPKQCKLATPAWLRQALARQLRLSWSPEQIAGWLKRAYPGQEAYQVSHETIYRSLFVQARGVLKKELVQHLRSQRTMRHSRHGNASSAVRLRSPLSTVPAGIIVPAFPQRSPPWLLTTAACGGLGSVPDDRTRRALLHLSYSCAHKTHFGHHQSKNGGPWDRRLL
jgi:hypothetical protein